MKKLPVLALMALMVSLATVQGGAVHAAHLSCGDTITSNTKLHADLTCSTTSGLIIGAVKITVDLNGHTILGAACGFCHGIRNGNFSATANPNPTLGYDKVTIKGPGTISGFEQGIRGDSANKFKIKKVTLTGQLSSSSIDIVGGKDLKIEHVTIMIPPAASPSVEGIRLMSVDKVKIKDVSVTGGDVGVNFGCAPCRDLGGPTNGTIEHSHFSGNGTGIFLADTTKAKVKNNVVTGSIGTGIIVGLGFLASFCPVSDVKLSKNTATGSGGSGIFLGGVTESKISKNISTANAGNRILLLGSSGSELKKNEFNGNGGLGIFDDSTGIATGDTDNYYDKKECTDNTGSASSPPELC